MEPRSPIRRERKTFLSMEAACCSTAIFAEIKHSESRDRTAPALLLRYDGVCTISGKILDASVFNWLKSLKRVGS
jgi:hypothetical protein